MYFTNFNLYNISSNNSSAVIIYDSRILLSEVKFSYRPTHKVHWKWKHTEKQIMTFKYHRFSNSNTSVWMPFIVFHALAHNIKYVLHVWAQRIICLYWRVSSIILSGGMKIIQSFKNVFSYRSVVYLLVLDQDSSVFWGYKQYTG